MSDRIKTGILTLSAAENYGAVLQSFSLCRFLNENFSDTEIIDFTPAFMINRYPLFKIRTDSIYSFFKTLVGSSIKFPNNAIKRYRFNKFRKEECTYSKNKYQIIFKEDIYDRYIVGSDQVFNLKLTNYDDEYMLPHISDKKKKNTYAASLGVSEIDEKTEKIFKKYLCDFNYLSVREMAGKKIVDSLLNNKSCEQMPDPVFLTSAEIWSSLCSKTFKKNYILIYAFADFERAYKLAKNLDESLEILYINNDVLEIHRNVNNVRRVGPSQFLSLIKNARYVITDSFHGVVFSIIFKKQFYCFLFRRTESRFLEVLNYFEFSSRVVDENNSYDTKEIEYSGIEKKIDGLQKKANAYFEKIYND